MFADFGCFRLYFSFCLLGTGLLDSACLVGFGGLLWCCGFGCCWWELILVVLVVLVVARVRVVRCGIAYFGLLCLWQCYGLLVGVVVIWCLGWVWVVVAWLLTGDFVWCLMIGHVDFCVGIVGSGFRWLVGV